MKKTLLGLLVLCMAVFTSCEKLDELTSYEDEFSANFDFEAQETAGDGVKESDEITSTLKEDLKKNKLDIDKAEAKLLGSSITLNTAGVTFADLKSAELYITANGKQEKIAWNTDIPTTAGSTIELTVNKEVDILTLLGADTYKFRVNYISRNAIKTAANATATIKVKISKK